MQLPSRPFKSHLTAGRPQQSPSGNPPDAGPTAPSRQQNWKVPPTQRVKHRPKPDPPPLSAAEPPPARDQECVGAPPPETTRPARGALYQPLQQEKCRIKPGRASRAEPEFLDLFITLWKMFNAFKSLCRVFFYQLKA
ncbi:hypothetical protein NDU88_006703 [Pleurodeles waltl]|uniref:Uncharacterized protein n=1 Tax=Pleurodeles waltl TaxID=8319 RepID=A0AAV7VMP0_PLEWA|nr:hypothetical protein NDU88_006703 [Pleurodeles waltl]